MQKTLIKNALLVVTCDDADRRIAGGDVLIEGNRIQAVGTGLTGPVDHTIDASGCVVIPGMVNTHHHLFQTLTRNTPGAQDCGLFDWLKHHYPIWRGITPEAVRVSTLVGLGELLLTGCTTAADHHYLFPQGQPLDLLDFSINAAKEVGTRFHASRGSMSMGESAGGLPPDSTCQKEDAILADCERVIKRYHQPEPGGMTRIVLSPCSPFSVTEDLMKATIQMAKQHRVHCHTHLAETLDEEVYCKEKFGLRPVALMEKLGWMEDFCWFAHTVHLNDAEIGQMAKYRTGVAHCPTSNMRLGSGIAPLPKLLAAGVPVGLGVDGSASNDSSDMVGEMRSALYVHRVHGDLKATNAAQILRVATRGGAAVLGRDDIGQLAPGKMADLAVFDLTGLPFAGSLADPLAALLFCGASHIAQHVLVNGEVVVANGKLTRIDEMAVAREANAVSRRLLNG